MRKVAEEIMQMADIFDLRKRISDSRPSVNSETERSSTKSRKQQYHRYDDFDFHVPEPPMVGVAVTAHTGD